MSWSGSSGPSAAEPPSNSPSKHRSAPTRRRSAHSEHLSAPRPPSACHRAHAASATRSLLIRGIPHHSDIDGQPPRARQAAACRPAAERCCFLSVAAIMERSLIQTSVGTTTATLTPEGSVRARGGPSTSAAALSSACYGTLLIFSQIFQPEGVQRSDGALMQECCAVQGQKQLLARCHCVIVHVGCACIRAHWGDGG